MISGTLTEELTDRTGAVPWRLIRALHLLATFVLVSIALSVTGLWEPRTYGAFELVRNTAGYIGLMAGTATLIGARLAWAPAFGFAAVVYIAAPKPLRANTAWWTCPRSPGPRHRPPGSPLRCSWPEPSSTRDSVRGLPRPPEHSSG
jgi:hypothetical protein